MTKVVSAKDETVRLFKSDFLEFFTRVHWSVPLILYIPLLIFFLLRILSNPRCTFVFTVQFFLLGLFVWTLVEYLLHRFLFHFQPRAKFLQRIFYLIHVIHHEYPQDSLRLVMPPVLSVPMAILFYLLFSAFLTTGAFESFALGFGVGYLSYDMIHYSVHHLPLKGRVGQFLKKHHLKHHFNEEHHGFGVSSPFWDHVFRTDFSKKSADIPIVS